MNDRYAASRMQHERAHRTLAGGVATAFRAVQRPVPITFASGHGAWLRDVDGHDYVDYALGFGPMLLGHSPDVVLDAVRRQLSTGLGYGACHHLEAELAEAVCRTMPCAELCAFSNTGSEAVHAAIRIARAATGRTRVIKFLGHYHGWLDPLHVGLPGADHDAPGTAGQDPAASASVTVCAWDDEQVLEAALGHDVAAVIMEPLPVNGGCLPASNGFLQAVRRMTTDAGTVLIFDEVITGYRLALGGAQERYGVMPDLAVLGKALGAGFPISAVCGRRDVMEVVASRAVAHVGTFNANPVCASAAVAAVGELESRAGEIYPRLEALGTELAGIFRDAAEEFGLPLVVNQQGGMAHAFWSGEPVDRYERTLQASPAGYRRFAEELLGQGVHVIPKGLLYVSAAHAEAELSATREAVRVAGQNMAAAA